MKNILKRIYALTIVIGMCTMSVCNAYGAVTNTGKTTIINSNFYTLAYERCSKAYDYGIGGKSEDDQIVKVTASDTLSETNYYVYTTWSKETYKGYLVLEANLYLPDTCKGFFFGTNTHRPISPTIGTNEIIRSQQWSNVVVIYDSISGTTQTYCNGILISSDFITSFNTRVNGTLYNNIRLVINDSVPGSVCYVDDFKLYETDVAPTVTNSLYIIDHEATSSLTVPENTLFYDAFQVSDPKAQLTLYTNSNYTKTRSLDEPLQDGNRLVMTLNGELRTYTIEVDNGIWVEDYNDNGTIEITKATGYIAKGMYGKSINDECLKVVADSSIPCFTTYTWLNDTFQGHILAEFNIMPGDMDSIYIGTNAQMPVSEPLRLVARRWNRVSVVYDTQSRDPDTGIGKATTYVNGVKYCETDTLFTHLTQLRVIMAGDAQSYAYIDDFKFEQHSYKAPSIEPMPALANNIEILNGNIIPTENMKVADLAAEDDSSTIKVFTDPLCNNELTGDDILSMGNVVVVEDGKGRYNYYTVYQSDNTKILSSVSDTSSNFNFSSGSVDPVYGLGGKDENDESFKVVIDNDSYNCYNDFTWTNTAFSGYLVTEFNVLPGTATVSVVTDNNTTLSAPITNITPLRWNKVVVVMDGASYDAATGKYDTYTYVNGAPIGNASTSLSSGGVVRLLVSGTGESYTYVDDIRIYETSTIPMITVPDLSDKYQVTGERIIFSSATKPEQLSAGRLVIRVYTDQNCTNLVENTNIANGNIIVVRDAVNTFKYYIAGDKPIKTTLFEAKGSPLDDNYLVGCQYSYESGKHYRDAGDTSYELKVAPSSTPPNAFFNYVYDEPGDNRFVLAEASIYFPEGYRYGDFQMCTDDYSKLSERITIGSNDLPLERWNRVVMAFDKKESKAHLYINGVEQHSLNVSGFPDEKKSIRFVAYADSGATMYFDDIVIYESDIMPAVTKAAVMPDSSYYIIYGAVLYASNYAYVSNIQSWIKSDTETTVRFYKDGQIVDSLSSSSLIPDESTMIIQTEDGHFTSYDIKFAKDYETIMYGTAESSGKLTNGQLTIAVANSNIFSSPTVGIAYYKDGSLVSIEQMPKESFVMFLKHSIQVDTSKYDTIKVFVWNTKSLKPLNKNGLLTSK